MIQVEVDGEMITGYIGCTDELDTKKASSKRVLVDGKEHAERKYMGIKNMIDYMSNTYPDTYQTMSELPEDFPDTSDTTNMYSTFYKCASLKKITCDTRKNKNFGYTFFRCKSVEELVVDLSQSNSPLIDDVNMYRMCEECLALKKITFKNAPIGTTIESFNNKRIPSQAEIIINYRSD